LDFLFYLKYVKILGKKWSYDIIYESNFIFSLFFKFYLTKDIKCNFSKYIGKIKRDQTMRFFFCNNPFIQLFSQTFFLYFLLYKILVLKNKFIKNNLVYNPYCEIKFFDPYLSPYFFPFNF
jgi:hypothetical protein